MSCLVYNLPIEWKERDTAAKHVKSQVHVRNVKTLANHVFFQVTSETVGFLRVRTGKQEIHRNSHHGESWKNYGHSLILASMGATLHHRASRLACLRCESAAPPSLPRSWGAALEAPAGWCSCCSSSCAAEAGAPAQAAGCSVKMRSTPQNGALPRVCRNGPVGARPSRYVAPPLQAHVLNSAGICA